MTDPQLDPEVIAVLEETDAAEKVVALLPERYPASTFTGEQGRIWELCGWHFLNHGRTQEALSVFWAYYLHELDAQSGGAWRSKATPLIMISECFARLNYHVHAKRYLMLALCDDAIGSEGRVHTALGVYWRAVRRYALRKADLERYGELFFAQSRQCSDEKIFPEALLQRLDDELADRAALTARSLQLRGQSTVCQMAPHAAW